jgi:hypothetical protein
MFWRRIFMGKKKKEEQSNSELLFLDTETNGLDHSKLVENSMLEIRQVPEVPMYNPSKFDIKYMIPKVPPGGIDRMLEHYLSHEGKEKRPSLKELTKRMNFFPEGDK